MISPYRSLHSCYPSQETDAELALTVKVIWYLVLRSGCHFKRGVGMSSKVHSVREISPCKSRETLARVR